MCVCTVCSPAPFLLSATVYLLFYRLHDLRISWSAKRLGPTQDRLWLLEAFYSIANAKTESLCKHWPATARLLDPPTFK